MVPCEITPKPITPQITITGTYQYTGAPITPSYMVTGVDGRDRVDLTPDDYMAEYENNINAGTGRILLSAITGAGRNYTWAGKATADFTISKTTYTGAMTHSTSSIYGRSGVYDLAGLPLPAGAVLGMISANDPEQLLDESPAIQGTTLRWSIKNQRELVGKSAEITIPVTETQNYHPFDIKVTVTADHKDLLPTPPESTNDTAYELTVESGIHRVPDTLKGTDVIDRELWETPEKIVNNIKAKLNQWLLSIEKVPAAIPEQSIDVYDVELLIKLPGQGWVKADKTNFPATGVTVTLPYPTGTGKDTHNFFVGHLIVESMNGLTAGSMEYPVITKTDAGIQFKAMSLSPITVAWEEIKKEPETQPEPTPPIVITPVTPNPVTPDPAPPADPEPDTTPSEAVSAPTGDRSAVMLWVLVSAVSGMTLCGMGLTRHKKDIDPNA